MSFCLGKLVMVTLSCLGLFSIQTVVKSKRKPCLVFSAIYIAIRLCLEVTFLSITNYRVVSSGISDLRFTATFSDSIPYTCQIIFNLIYTIVISFNEISLIYKMEENPKFLEQYQKQTVLQIQRKSLITLILYVSCMFLIVTMVGYFTLRYRENFIKLYFSPGLVRESWTKIVLTLYGVPFQQVSVLLTHLLFIITCLYLFTQLHQFNVIWMEQTKLNNYNMDINQILEFGKQHKFLITTLDKYSQLYNIHLGVNIILWIVSTCTSLSMQLADEGDTNIWYVF